MDLNFIGTLVILAVGLVVMSGKVGKEYERAVVFRLGRLLKKSKGPGLIIIIPFIDRWVRVNLRSLQWMFRPRI
jgi:regulator of protease activity HflC (stomatin/prohibitin superfamily)